VGDRLGCGQDTNGVALHEGDAVAVIGGRYDGFVYLIRGWASGKLILGDVLGEITRIESIRVRLEKRRDEPRSLTQG
jgi:hypothetical protein